MTEVKSVAQRMRELGWTAQRQAAFAREHQALENKKPQFKALNPGQLTQMLERAGSLLGMEVTLMRGYHAEVYLYPQSLVYAWDASTERRTLLINADLDYLALPAATPYWEALKLFEDGERTG